MSTLIAPLDHPTRPGRRERRVERRRLTRQDALSRRLAELHAICHLLDQAAEVVRGGWVQGAWFRVATTGGTRLVTAYNLALAGERPVVGACLVGSVVHAAGGPRTVRSQLVQRTLDISWQALREEAERPGQLCPAPAVRQMRLLDLTHWNDAPGRTQNEVVGLLLAARQGAEAEKVRSRAETADPGSWSPAARDSV